MPVFQIVATTLRALAITALVVGLWASMTHAQDFERYRPHTLTPQPGRAELPPPPEIAPGDATVVLEQLKSVVVFERPEQVVKDRALTEADYPAGVHVKVESSSLLNSPALRGIVEPYLGKPVSFAQLNSLVREIITYYRRNDRPVVDVSIPEQNIKEGVLQLLVVEGRVGQVCVSGARWFNPDMLLRQTYTSCSDRIHESTLLADVDWLNQNPFRRVDLELKPGAKFGETDVIFNVKDRFPMRGYVGYEDTGTQSTEIERLLFGFQYGNGLWRDHQLSYQYTASPDFVTLSSHTGIYSIPLLNRDHFNIFGSYATVESDLPPFGQQGLAWQASWRYVYELCDWGCLEHRLNLGFDFKKTNTNLDFGGSAVFASSADVAQMAFGYQGSRADGSGITSFGSDTYISPGGFSSGNSDFDFNVIRPGATANYYYNRTFIERQQRLRLPLIFISRLTGQWANANLLPSETLGFGGYGSVRGYDQRIVNGDDGIIGNFELRTNSFSPLKSRRYNDQLQLISFYDVGQAYFHEPAPGQPNGYFLSGIGVGMRYAIDQWLTVRCDYGWQLNQVPNQPGDSRVHLGIVFAR